MRARLLLLLSLGMPFLLAAPALAASLASETVLASEPGTLVLTLGGLAALSRFARGRRKRTVIFPLFERKIR